MGVLDDFFSGFTATVRGRRQNNTFNTVELSATNSNTLSSFNHKIINNISKSVTSSQISSKNKITNTLNMNLSRTHIKSGVLVIDQNINLNRNITLHQKKIAEGISSTLGEVYQSLGRKLTTTASADTDTNSKTLTVDSLTSGVHKEQDDKNIQTTTVNNIMREVKDTFVQLTTETVEEVANILNQIHTDDTQANQIDIVALDASVDGVLDLNVSQKNTTLSSILMDLDLGDKVLRSLASVSGLSIADENNENILQKVREIKNTESRVDSLVLSLAKSYFTVICFVVIVLFLLIKL